MIIHKTSQAYIISHPEGVKYKDLNNAGESYALHKHLFRITTPFIKNKSFIKDTDLSPVTLRVKSIYEGEVKPYYDKVKDASSPSDEHKDRNDVAVSLAKEFYAQTDYQYEKFHGANSTDSLVITEFKGRTYVFPPRSRFYNCQLFGYDFGGGTETGEEKGTTLPKYDLVVMDPPWKNKFIKRRKGSCMGYDTHSIEDIGNLGISSILHPNAIVAIWSTNSKTDKILNLMLDKWGLQHITTFYWLKITLKGELTCPFTKPGGKQPYESIIIASNNNSNSNPPYDPCKMRILVSTPSAINSHKPPLTEVLEDYFQTKFTSKCELFARYLMSGYTSYGNQVIKLNNAVLFN